ncbi:MAG: tyrosine-protein phosphatase [Endomicrobia bacterium]|nr:tyrosine-protein phosphatase [Endomicrobiia bacterium]
MDSKRIVPAVAERTENGDYVINFKESGNFKVFSGNSEKSMEKEVFLRSSGKSISVRSNFPQERLLFKISKDDNPDFFYVSERHIPMRGTPNFRDLGGIVNKHGRQIKWGKFFRSGNISSLTDEDLEYFKTLKIKKVIDLRSRAEIEREPEKLPRGGHIKYINVPISNPAEFGKLVEEMKNSSGAQNAVDAVMLKGAHDFTSALAEFKPVIDAMIEGGPFLCHCSAGKDRTGIASALILSILDVEKAAVLEDYMLSNEYTVPYFSKYISFITELGIPEDIARAASGVKKEFLETTLNDIGIKYGSFDEMAKEVFGIDAEIKKELLRRFTY